jgi:hypothetical protein
MLARSQITNDKINYMQWCYSFSRNHKIKLMYSSPKTAKINSAHHASEHCQ